MRKVTYATSAVVFVIDWGVSAMASLLSILLLRWITQPMAEFGVHVLKWFGVALVASFVGLYLSGAYKFVLRYSSLRAIGKCFQTVLLKEILIVAVLLTRFFRFGSLQFNVGVVLSDGLITVSALVLMRVIVTMLLESRHSIEENIVRMSVLVYGVSNKSVAMLTRLASSAHYNVIGFLTSDRKLDGQIIQDHKIYYVDSQQDLERLCATVGGVDSVLFAKEDDTDEQSVLIHACMALGIHVLVSPRIDEVKFDGLSQRAMQAVTRDVEYIPDGMSALERNFKRAVDCVVAAVSLVIFSPLMLCCYILVRREDHGPAIYKQERIGRFGRPFYIYKFRTMRMDAEDQGPALFAGSADTRLTRIGRFLRAHHLDELPQLYNVLCGDMAFVGWRPERKVYIDQIMEVDPRYYYLYQIRPGVTSYATLHNGYTDTIEKMLRRLEFDLYYLKNRSWWFDMKILSQTFASIVFGNKF
ncbi:MAG: exopolysaccharide biosynthesis polyprenyl glycosylphosphotransferase [Bacteroidales bacterium]|nr:exopolysaccharide biosynthesis polyprenyl glycosylphosphotransferase [Bacteroidales bacterium]